MVGMLALVVAALVVTVAPAHNKKSGNGNGNGLHAFLDGFQEVPSNSTTGQGKFKARINNGTIEYKLKYRNLEAPVKFAHIHVGQRGVNGGVAAFLCGGGDKPACPASGEVTGVIDAADVIGPADQGVAAGEIAELINLIKHGVTYANVHTDKFPNGEIRGQIGGGKGKFGFKNGHFKNNGDSDADNGSRHGKGGGHDD
jgi:hypothetical protein